MIASPERDSWSIASANADRLRELARHARVELVERHRRLALLLERQLRQRGRLVRQPPRQQLVGDDAERVDVGARAGLLAARLLGREVGGGAEHRPDLGDARLVDRAGDPEVGELDDVGVGDEQVAGLDVAVHDAVAMRVVEAAAGLGDDLDRLLDVEVAAVAQQLGARVAGDVLHHDEVLVVALVEAEVEHLNDVRVHEPGSGERLAAEARDERRVVGEVLGQQLQRDVALEALVEGEVHGRHAADAEPALDPVAACDRRRVHCPLPPFPLPPPLPPPSPAPPLPVVEVVPGVELVVAEVVVVVGGVVVEVGVLVEVVVGVLVEVRRAGRRRWASSSCSRSSWQSAAASWPTVRGALGEVPAQRRADRDGKVCDGVAEARHAVAAAPHWPASTAEEMASSWLFRFEASTA